MWGVLGDRIVFHLVSGLEEGMRKQRLLRVWVG